MFRIGFEYSWKPFVHHGAECRNGNDDSDTVRQPAQKNTEAKARAAARSMKSRSAPVGRRSAANPPWLTTPLAIPNRPVLNAVRLGRHGTSEANTFAKRTAVRASSSMFGVVARGYPAQWRWS